MKVYRVLRKQGVSYEVVDGPYKTWDDANMKAKKLAYKDAGIHVPHEFGAIMDVTGVPIHPALVMEYTARVAPGFVAAHHYGVFLIKRGHTKLWLSYLIEEEVVKYG